MPSVAIYGPCKKIHHSVHCSEKGYGSKHVSQVGREASLCIDTSQQSAKLHIVSRAVRFGRFPAYCIVKCSVCGSKQVRIRAKKNIKDNKFVECEIENNNSLQPVPCWQFRGVLRACRVAQPSDFAQKGLHSYREV